MLLLAIDSSQASGSFTLARLRGPNAEIIATVGVQGGTFSAQLIPQIGSALAEHGFSKSDISALAACTGPGSFTGLRIGLAAVKALAEVWAVPVIAISSLELLARDASGTGTIVAVLDARRQEFFIGQLVNGVFDRESLLTEPELALYLAASKPACLVTSEERVIRLATAAGIPTMRREPPSSLQLARVAAQKLVAGETISAAELDANYLRRDENLFFTRR